MRTISNTEFAAHPEMYLDMAQDDDVRIQKGNKTFRIVYEPAAPKSTWQQAVDEGAMTVDEFFDEVRRQMREDYEKRGNA